MAAALGMSRDALENRIYERKGQSPLVETALQMQAFSSTTFFAEAVAHQSGGVFVKLPDGIHFDQEELLTKFNELYSEIGQLSGDFREFTQDGEIDPKESAQLSEHGQKIHRAVQELLGLAFSIYCRKE